MPTVDTLLTLLVEDSRNIAARMAAAGLTQDETRGAWNYARQAGYTETTGLGQDRLTDAGRERARQLILGAVQGAPSEDFCLNPGRHRRADRRTLRSHPNWMGGGVLRGR